MSTSTRQRGRPRGSGIDDSRTIQQILELLDRNPKMKPTTAIRALGIENESVIRRLRDKLRGMSEQSLRPVPRPIPHTPTVPSEPVQVTTANLNVPREPVKRSNETLPKIGYQEVPTGPADDSAFAADEPFTEQSQPQPPEIPAPPPAAFAQLPMAIFAATVSASQFLAVNNALFFQARMREAARANKPQPTPTACPNCGHHIP